MIDYFVEACTAFVLSWVLTPLIRRCVLGTSFVDRPDGSRKVHAVPTPRLGGVAIACAYLGALLLLPVIGGSQNAGFLLRVLPAGIAIFALGLADDLLHLQAKRKLLGQLLAAGVAYSCGIRIIVVYGHPVDPWLSLPLTLMWLVVCTNAFNLIDGLDGLAAGAALFAAGTLLVAALLHGDTFLALAVAPLGGALLGFLRYNFNPASIFLGDGGSLLVGFLLGCYAIMWQQKSATLLGLAAPAMAMGLPLIDTGLSIVRRYLRGQSILDADRGHIHHRLLDRGFTHRKAVLVLYAVCAAGAVLAILSTVVYPALGTSIVLLFAAGALAGIKFLHYDEIEVAGELLRSGVFRNAIHGALTLGRLREAIRQQQSLDQCWPMLAAKMREFGFLRLELDWGGRCYYESGDGEGAKDCYALSIALSGEARIRLYRAPSGNPLGLSSVLFTDLVVESLRLRLWKRTSEALEMLPVRKPDGHAPSAAAISNASSPRPTRVL